MKQKLWHRKVRVSNDSCLLTPSTDAKYYIRIHLAFYYSKVRMWRTSLKPTVYINAIEVFTRECCKEYIKFFVQRCAIETNCMRTVFLNSVSSSVILPLSDLKSTVSRWNIYWYHMLKMGCILRLRTYFVFNGIF